MTKHIISLMTAAVLNTGCAATMPQNLSSPTSTSIPTSNNPLAPALIGSADVGINLSNGPMIRVHNDDSVKVRIDRASSSDGYVYETEVDIYATFPVAAKNVSLITMDKNGKVVQTYNYSFYQPGQKSFALAANQGLKFSSEYTFLVKGTDPATGDIYQKDGGFKTGALKFRVSHPTLNDVANSTIREGVAEYQFQSVIADHPIILSFRVNYRQIDAQAFDMSRHDQEVQQMIYKIYDASFTDMKPKTNDSMEYQGYYLYKVGTNYQSNVNAADPTQNTVDFQLNKPFGTQVDGTPVARLGDRLQGLEIGLKALQQRLAAGGTINQYIK